MFYTHNNKINIMKKYGVFYGSLTGTTAAIAQQIAQKLGVEEADVHNVSETPVSALGDYEILVAGTSTWGSGEVQEDWYDFIDGMKGVELSGKKVALFGCGDENMSDTFCNGVAVLYKAFKDADAEMIAPFNPGPYDFSESEAVQEGVALGLLLDEVNHSDLSEARIDEWLQYVK